MADEVPTGDKAIFAFFEMLSLAFAFEGTAAWLRGESIDRFAKAYVACVILFVLGIAIPVGRRRIADTVRVSGALSKILVTIGLLVVVASGYYSFFRQTPTLSEILAIAVLVTIAILSYLTYSRSKRDSGTTVTTPPLSPLDMQFYIEIKRQFSELTWMQKKALKLIYQRPSTHEFDLNQQLEHLGIAHNAECLAAITGVFINEKSLLVEADRDGVICPHPAHRKNVEEILSEWDKKEPI